MSLVIKARKAINTQILAAKMVFLALSDSDIKKDSP